MGKFRSQLLTKIVKELLKKRRSFQIFLAEKLPLEFYRKLSDDLTEDIVQEFPENLKNESAKEFSEKFPEAFL